MPDGAPRGAPGHIALWSGRTLEAGVSPAVNWSEVAMTKTRKDSVRAKGPAVHRVLDPRAPNRECFPDGGVPDRGCLPTGGARRPVCLPQRTERTRH